MGATLSCQQPFYWMSLQTAIACIGTDWRPPRQVQELAQRHRLSLSAEEIDRLMAMVSGHPYLVRVALYELGRDRIALPRLLQVAPTEEGPYDDHLRRHLLNLKAAGLEGAIATVIASPQPIQIAAEDAFQLRSRGLVKFQGNTVVPLCNLYRLYFRDRLQTSHQPE